MAKPASVEAYLAALPDEERGALQELRETIASVVSDGAEAISWQMPSIKYRGRALVGYAAFKDHCSFFPMSGAVVEAFADELAGYETSKGTIRFDPKQPLPAALVKKIVKARIAEVDSRRGR